MLLSLPHEQKFLPGLLGGTGGGKSLLSTPHGTDSLLGPWASVGLGQQMHSCAACLDGGSGSHPAWEADGTCEGRGAGTCFKITIFQEFQCGSKIQFTFFSYLIASSPLPRSHHIGARRGSCSCAGSCGHLSLAARTGALVVSPRVRKVSLWGPSQIAGK